MNRSPDKENSNLMESSGPGWNKKTQSGGSIGGGGGGGASMNPKAHHVVTRRTKRSPHQANKGGGPGAAQRGETLGTSSPPPSDSGDQASRGEPMTIRRRPPLQPVPSHQPQPYYPVMPIMPMPHFIRDGVHPALHLMSSPAPTNADLQPQFRDVFPAAAGTGGGGYFDVHKHLNQQHAFCEMLEDDSAGIKAVVEKQGYISLRLRYDTQVDIAPNQAIRIINHRKGITLALSGCATQMALVHPNGRVLQYNSRIEIQTEDFLSIKNAKMWPRGVSFTANNCALVYLVDQAGARSTTDTFHDLYADNIADTVFLKSCQFAAKHPNEAIMQSINLLENADYWRTDSELDCWLINDVNIKQTPDGLVSVERKHGCEMFTLKTSPSNGKARLQSSFLYLTASMGEESHIFVKSNDRRIHYNGHTFVVRNAGHSAGFDESGLLRIW